MLRNKKLLVRLSAAFAMLLAVALVWGQLTGGLDAIRARARADEAMRQAYITQPGGAPEDSLWTFLVLMGANDRKPSEWRGSVSIASGDIHSIDGYRFELPDRVLPQGGWVMSTKLEKILSSSPVEE